METNPTDTSAAARQTFASMRKPRLDPKTAARLGTPEFADYYEHVPAALGEVATHEERPDVLVDEVN